MTEVELRDFVYNIEIAKEKAKEILGSEDPIVIASLAQTHALLSITNEVHRSQQEIREGLNYIVSELEKGKA